MSYQVQYGPITAFESAHRHKKTKGKLLCICVLLLALITVLIWPAAADAAGNILFPWSDAAAAAFRQAFDAGGIGDALTAFCNEVLAESGV